MTTLQPGVTISGEANQGKPTYATTVTTANQSANAPRHPRESVIARITTHNGILAVIFKVKDYYGIMAEECRLTIIGRFLKVRPQIDRIRNGEGNETKNKNKNKGNQNLQDKVKDQQNGNTQKDDATVDDDQTIAER
ncbi:hypothetical protein H5410_044331 [Solanum commersonii]|uniref:Uncharacterized protein n=1 Tax=Solanum commersonii TaxID=4109 RepID=A0A9J5X6H2_SOLCO|nr:hypothetical protein H5410_044331 [Solanum commersonii]